MEARKQQSAYEREHLELGRLGSSAEHVYKAMFRYLRQDLGLSEPVATERAETEVQNKIARNFCDNANSSD